MLICKPLSPAQFWDVDRATVDHRQHARWLVERVLQRGTYDKQELRQLLPALRLDTKGARFLTQYCSS